MEAFTTQLAFPIRINRLNEKKRNKYTQLKT